MSYNFIQGGIHDLTYKLPVINGKTSYVCNTCPKEFSQLSNLKAHLRIHSGEKPYKCSHCGKGFTQLAHKQKHELIHTGEKPYQCEACDRGFTSSSNLKVHQKMHEGSAVFQCHECPNKYLSLLHMEIHREMHKIGKTCKCPLCGKKFLTVGQMAHHWRVDVCLPPDEYERCFQILCGTDMEAAANHARFLCSLPMQYKMITFPPSNNQVYGPIAFPSQDIQHGEEPYHANLHSVVQNKTEGKQSEASALGDAKKPLKETAVTEQEGEVGEPKEEGSRVGFEGSGTQDRDWGRETSDGCLQVEGCEAIYLDGMSTDSCDGDDGYPDHN